jgi:diaminopropionate ammonia-lyase
MEQNCQYLLNHPDRPKLKLSREFNSIIRAKDILAFHRSIKEYTPTPLLNLAKLSKNLDIKELWIKDESLRFNLNTFKALGASYAIHKYLEGKQEDVTFCTATDGNHGRSVAWAAMKFGQKAVIFVPNNIAQSRISNILKYKGSVTVVEGDYDAAVIYAREEAEKKGYVLMQDTSWPGYTIIPSLITAGYTTIMEEIDEHFSYPKAPVFDFVFLQAGVGSFASSVVAYFRNRYRGKMPKFILVEPSEADGFLESARNNLLSQTRRSQQTIMAGLNCGTPSSIAWEILKDGIDLFLTIPDKYAVKAMQDLYFPFKNDHQVFSGESGAAGLGGLIALSCNPGLREIKKQVGLDSQSRVLVFNTEGVTDPDSFEETLSKEVELY